MYFHQGRVLSRGYKMVQKRQTAQKVWIKNLVNGSYQKDPGEFGPSYVVVKDLKCGRVNLIATVIHKYQNETGNYYNLTLDDGSGSVKVKTWNEDVKLLQNSEIGDQVLIVGKPKENNGEIFISPEIVKKTDPVWIQIRKKELGKLWGAVERDQIITVAPENVDEGMTIIEEDIVEEPVKPSESLRQKILDFVSKGDDGVNKSELIFSLGIESAEAENTIKEMIKEGEVYEIKEKIKLT